MEHRSNHHEAGLVLIEDIGSRIFTVRGVQVMMDTDLARLYRVEVKRLNEQVKRNKERFPSEFMFQISKEEYDLLRSQDATIEMGRGKHRKYLPYVFTESGVAMLSSVLRSDRAIEMSVKIIKAFIAMRRFILSNAQVFNRLDILERKQLETERNMEKVLRAIESDIIQPVQGIFFDGQVFDAYRFLSDLFRSAERSIVIIDNFIDDTVLVHLLKRREGVKVLLLTKRISRSLLLDIEKFNKQYPAMEYREFKSSHDRFIIIDGSDVYHFGASLKDLGKKWFAFSKMDIGTLDLLSRLDGVL